MLPWDPVRQCDWRKSGRASKKRTDRTRPLVKYGSLAGYDPAAACGGWRIGEPMDRKFLGDEGTKRRLADQDTNATTDILTRSTSPLQLYSWRVIERMSNNFSSAAAARTKGPLRLGNTISRKKPSGMYLYI